MAWPGVVRVCGWFTVCQRLFMRWALCCQCVCVLSGGGRCVDGVIVCGWGPPLRAGQLDNPFKQNKNESDQRFANRKKCRFSAVLVKPLDNPFKMIHTMGEQEQKTKDNEHEQIGFYYSRLF